MTLRARSCAAALVTVGLALYTESAHADAAGANAPLTCNVGLGPFQAPITLPANAPALLVVDRSGGNSPTIVASLVSGTTSTPVSAATDANGLWTLPLDAAAATPGSYSVEIESTCATLSDKQSSVTALTLTDPVAFPTSVGTLVHVPTNPPTGVDKVRLEPTDGMRAFMPAAQIELVVNGTPQALNAYPNAKQAIELAVNTGDACVENGALHREKRVVKVTIEGAIAGLAASPAPASVDVEIDCGAIKWTSGLDRDGNGKTPAESTGSTTTSPSSSSAPASDSGGCSASPVGTHGGGFGLGVLALAGLGLVGMRRRRAR